jgi:hypothetical protein
LGRKIQGKYDCENEENLDLTNEQIVNVAEVSPAVVSRIRKRIQKSVSHN